MIFVIQRVTGAKVTIENEVRGEIGKGYMVLIGVADTDTKEIADKIIRNDLSVRATERLAEKVKDELRPERKKRKKAAEADKTKAAEITAVERELMTLLGTKVNIAGDDRKGKIELEYYSLDELNRLIDSLRDAFR